MLARPWQRNGWGRAVVQLRSILSTHLILQGTSVGPSPLQIQEPLGQCVDVASRLLQSRVQQSPLNQALLKTSRTFAHRSHKLSDLVILRGVSGRICCDSGPELIAQWRMGGLVSA